MKKLGIFVLLILLFSVTVLAENNVTRNLGSNEYVINDITCVGQLLMQVNSASNTNYEIDNCVMTDTNKTAYTCDCSKKPLVYNTQIDTPLNLAIRLQYNIAQPRIIPPKNNNTQLTQDEIYNQQLQRIETKVIDLKKTETQNDDKGFSLDGADMILITFLTVGLIAIIIFGVIVALVMNYPKFKRWCGVADDDKLTLGQIFRAIFRREDIRRKSMSDVKNTQAYQKISQARTSPVKKETKKDDSNSKDYSSEVNDLLKDL